MICYNHYKKSLRIFISVEVDVVLHKLQVRYVLFSLKKKTFNNNKTSTTKSKNKTMTMSSTRLSGVDI